MMMMMMMMMKVSFAVCLKQFKPFKVGNSNCYFSHNF